jgi:hypothetical protein
MSEHKFECPACGQRIACDSSAIGKAIACPVCKVAFSIPPPPVESVSMAPGPVTMGSTVPSSTSQSQTQAAPTAPPPAPFAAAAPRPMAPAPMRQPAMSAEARAKAVGAVPQVGKNYSRLAAASFICSIVLGVGWLAGIVCGHLAKARIRRNPLLDGAGLATAGLVISYLTLFGLVASATGFAVYLHGWQPVVTIRNTDEARNALAGRVVDEVIVADSASEGAHGMSRRQGYTQHSTGYDGTNRWRGVQGRDAFAYVMQVLPDVPMTLNCRFKDDPNQRLFNVIVNDEMIGTEVYRFNVPGDFYDVEYRIPESLTRGKKEINVTFESQDAMVMGKLYGCQVLRP